MPAHGGCGVTVVAGIDEAGFGPRLGPLVMSGAAFRVRDDQADACLWHVLRETCTRKLTPKARRLAVADSKALHNGDDLALLERAALVMLAVHGDRPTSWHTLLQAVAPHAVGPARAYPWYCTDFDLPTSDATGDVATRANAVGRNCREQSVEFLGAFCEPLAEQEYNRRIAETQNKAAVNMDLAVAVTRRVLDASGDPDVRVFVDRLGGRTRYAGMLQSAFPDWTVEVVNETFARSAYAISGAGRTVRIEFAVGGEDHHFATALASVYSKYVRELYMQAFNRYWSQRVQGLRPTAGYFGDAGRWLKEAGPTIRHMAVEPSVLVRSR
jgi:ribonuclease HII